jgi:hypothetical protein
MFYVQIRIVFSSTWYPSLMTNRIGGVMVSVLASSVVDRGFEPWSGQTKDWNWYLLLLR